MGSKLTILENRTYNRIEMRMWVHPARPDHFEKIIRIKPGGSIRVKAKDFHDDRNHQDRLEYEKVLVLVYVNGVWRDVLGSFLQNTWDWERLRRISRPRKPDSIALKRNFTFLASPSDNEIPITHAQAKHSPKFAALVRCVEW